MAEQYYAKWRNFGWVVGENVQNKILFLDSL
jgi:hypothetical protein